jgi:iron complex transport system substrate-binding protein
MRRATFVSAHPRGIAAALLVALLAAGAAAAAPPAATASTPVAAPAAAPAASARFIDDTGAAVAIARPAARIVSLAPGATELLFAAGAGERIVGTARDDDSPAYTQRIERIGDANAVSYERLVALKPDVVVAWEDLTNRLVVDSLRKLKLPIYFVRARSIADLPGSVRRMGAMAGTGAVAERAAQDLERRIAALDKRPAPKGEPLRVFYMIWDTPLYTVGSRHIISDAIARCGGRSIFDDIDFPAPIVEFESVIKRDPDVILMSAPPITARDWRERWQRFTTVRAVETGQVLTYSDKRLDRMGPAAIDAVQGLCAVLDKVPRAN